MSKGSVLARIQKEWKGLLLSFQEMPPETLLEPNVVGTWSVRDVLAHITTWEEEASQALSLILNDQPLPRYAKYGGIDAFNAREWEKKKDLPLDQVKNELVATHERLVRFLDTVPENQFIAGKRFLRRLRLDTFNHYREHTLQILAWRNQQGV